VRSAISGSDEPCGGPLPLAHFGTAAKTAA